MNSQVLAGVLAASAVTQVAFGVFFVLAHRLRREQAEYLLFGCLCWCLSVTTASLSALQLTTEVGYGLVKLANGTAIVAVPLHLHFVHRFAGRRRTEPVLVAAYAFAALLELGNLTVWWGPEAWATTTINTHRQTDESVLASAPLAFISGVFVLGLLLESARVLYRCHREGREEALNALVGLLVLFAVSANDVSVLTGLWASTLLLPHGFLAYAFGVATTLLLRYRTAAGELQQTVRQLDTSARQLQRSNEDLKLVQAELIKKEQLAAVGELAAVIAHEVRNPLAVIVNAVAGLRRPKANEGDRQTLLGIVEEETARLNRLVTDLLRYARPVVIRRTPVSVAELLSRWSRRGDDTPTVELSIEQAEVPPDTIWVDPSLFRVALDNLVDNARQAMGVAGTVALRVRGCSISGQAGVAIEIADSGKGMDSEVLRRARDPFFTTRPSGTGLGLPIVQRIIEAHGGVLEIQSEPARGTKVTLRVPVASPEDDGKEASPRV